MTRYLMVFLGAAVGGMARYAASSFIFARYPSRFSVGTIVVNVSGCFLIGILMTLFTERGDPNPNLRLLLVTGILGGYTTFSSFAWESFAAIDKDQMWVGLANITITVVLGYLAVWCGSLLARTIK